MKNLSLFAILLFFASCQSQYSTTDHLLPEDVPVKIAHSGINFTPNTPQSEWYSELSEVKEFENYEEENGILLGKKHSVATYSHTENQQVKLIILEKIRHQSNGEASFKQLDMVKIKLKRNQFLTTSFCSKNEQSNTPILAIYEGSNQSSNAKKIVKAWEVQLENLQLESIAVNDIECMDDF